MTTSIRLVLLLWLSVTHAAAFVAPRQTTTVATTRMAQSNDNHNDDDKTTRPDPTLLGFDAPRESNDKNARRRNTLPSLDDPWWSRFVNPTLDDPFLPLADVGVAQLVAPGLQVLWLNAHPGAPAPSWMHAFTTTGPGSLLAPTLVHGAALASCWIVGALAARAYERNSIVPQRVVEDAQNNDDDSNDNDSNDNDYDYGPIVRTVLQAGAFATGVLMLSTQCNVYWDVQQATHFRDLSYIPQYGDSDAVNFRIQVAVIELVNDVVFEAVCLAAWRWFLAAESLKASLRR